MSNAISPWAAATGSYFEYKDQPEIFRFERQGYTFTGHLSEDSFFIKATWSGGGQLAFRPVFAPAYDLEIGSQKNINNNQIHIVLNSAIGKYDLEINLPENDTVLLNYKTTLTPAYDLLIPFWPRDIIATGTTGNIENTAGQVIVKQVGTRSGQLYFHMTRPKAGAVFYLQNLTALADYCEQTQTSAANVVGGEWPELGMALPPTTKGTPLKANQAVVISDAFVAFDPNVPADEAETVRQYLNFLSTLYLQLPKPDTNYTHWPDILEKGLKDLIDSPGCWAQVGGNHYFNAYVCDYVTPPEIMVQLAIILPLIDYAEWSGKTLDVIDRVKKGIPVFYDKKLGTLMRWHPKLVEDMEADEEQKKPMVMDSWYLHHPLHNLSRLALKGDKVAEKLFLDSIEFSIKVAHHFNYEWPVFYKIDTLEVVKAETEPGAGGEKDVPGLYALIMLQAWELTGNKRYLTEAEKAAQHLQGKGFELLYQANNTAFSAGALLRLYKITKKNVYLELSYLCLANIFKNVQLWDCNYGYGKNFPSFFTLFPLDNAPYAAVYEEQEVFCAFHDYLHNAQHIELFEPVRLLMTEYIRYLVDRAPYYYPPMLPKEMLQEDPKTGEIDPNLWIALEDLHDGWEKSGQVGQEVYGAGNAFGILPRHYMRVPEAHFLVYTDYPIYNFEPVKQKPVKFKLAGDGRLTSRLMVVKDSAHKLPPLKISCKGQEQALKGKTVKDGNQEYLVPGDAELTIEW
ncbi:hypothetical protein [Mucilaginibacter panaciglaebae]|uniref:Alpha-L-rhamnosidase six-hairpin glycosidase domain-containing protein n=1 Tax=Mucilaginibacter panaciglaebae TaxID=502331 RepID=A0ABP7WXX2_9SPHI